MCDRWLTFVNVTVSSVAGKQSPSKENVNKHTEGLGELLSTTKYNSYRKQ